MLVDDIRIIDFLDILIVATFLYLLLVWFKKTRSTFIFLGFVMASTVYVLVRLLKLQLSVTIMHSFVAVILVAFIIIFQEELRRVFEHIALFSLHPKREGEQILTGIRRDIDIISGTVFDLATEHIGAIVILPATDSIERHVQGGIDLNGLLSSAVLQSVFDTHSDGHDGAVIVERGRITQFGCRLPLSENSSASEKGGTRHAAALGLSEVSDAFCLVVSEERGIVSFCRYGRMEKVDSREKLAALLQDFYDQVYPAEKSRRAFLHHFTANFKEKTVALLAAVVLWFVIVHESAVVYRSYTIPVQHVGLDNRLRVVKTEPAEVRIILSAPRREFYFVERKDIRLVLNLFFTAEHEDRSEMKYEAIATASDIRLPGGLNIVNIFPRSVMVHVKSTTLQQEGQRAGQ
ncbi:MAG: DNA integrity scanning protein DisA nucleotide-binding domain protein [Phycisphaerae bacterium]|nr:DNA integrity scanning protein DisA nucleotide-binding domain protein [Phycisphaerae bacterium]